MENLKLILGNSGLLGLHNIIKAKHLVIKLAWISCLLVLSFWCVIFLKDTINGYMDFEVVTNIDVIREQEAEFPSITLCFSSETKLEDALITCSFDAKLCNVSDFEIYTSVLNEICYRFNSGKNNLNELIDIKKTSRYDLGRGLMLFLKVYSFANSELLSFDSPFKCVVFIQNSSTIFRRDRAYNIDSGIQIPVGTTLISFERDFIEKLPKPYSGCVEQDTNDFVSHLFQYFIKNNKTYLQKDCFDLCLEEIILSKCNCSKPIGDISKCSEIEMDCIQNMYFRINNEKKSLPQSCENLCPNECESINYIFYQNFLGLLSDEFLLMNNFTSDFNKNGIFLSFYYSTLEYTLIKQIPKTKIFDLVSNLGGTLGLFLGLSFLSFTELLGMLFECIYHIFQSKNKIHFLV